MAQGLLGSTGALAMGWELHVADVGVTQCDDIGNAKRVVRDFLASVGREDAETATIHVLHRVQPPPMSHR